jgi:hypothetical protein
MDALAVTKDKFNAALQCLPDERDRQDPAPRAPHCAKTRHFAARLFNAGRRGEQTGGERHPQSIDRALAQFLSRNQFPHQAIEPSANVVLAGAAPKP